MKKGLHLLFLSFFLCKIILCQRIENNAYITDIDEPFQFNKELIKNNYHVINIYSCPDTIFSKSKCVCKAREIYNDSGRIVKLIAGNDIDNSKINYAASYISTTDSLSLFRYYDTSHNKTTFIYPREPTTKNVKIKSTLLYPTRSSLPDTIFRYDITDRNFVI